VVPWNAYPWYINAKPTVVQLAAGVEPLRGIIELMPRLRVVLLLGTDAKRDGACSSQRMANWFGHDISACWRPTTRAAKRCSIPTGRAG